MWQLDLNWQMTVFFLLALGLLVFVMKLVALLLPAATKSDRSFVFWLFPSPNSLKRLRPANAISQVVFRALGLLFLLFLSYWLYGRLVSGVGGHGMLLNYAALPILLLMMEFLMTLITMIWLPTGHLFPPVHNRPWLARSLADFWGQRWNLWFSDWFRYTLLSRLRRWPIGTLVLIFAISGVMHEWVLNVPLFCLTGRVMFGSMMVYFLLQAAGLLLERRFLKGCNRLKIGFAWLVILAPAPLIMNEGLLRTLHLWPEQVSIAHTLVEPKRVEAINTAPRLELTP